MYVMFVLCLLIVYYKTSTVGMSLPNAVKTPIYRKCIVRYFIYKHVLGHQYEKPKEHRFNLPRRCLASRCQQCIRPVPRAVRNRLAPIKWLESS